MKHHRWQIGIDENYVLHFARQDKFPDGVGMHNHAKMTATQEQADEIAVLLVKAQVDVCQCHLNKDK